VTAPVVASDINELGTLVAGQLAAQVQANVSFYYETATDPSVFVTNVILNTTQGVFKIWSADTGAYVPMTQFAVGDVKNNFSGLDSVSTGWVLLDGRAIAAVPGLSGVQQVNLTNLFPAGTLPVVTPPNIVGLPVGNAFGAIPQPVMEPAAGAFTDQVFTNPPTDLELDRFGDLSEELRGTVNGVREYALTATQDVSQQMLNALNGIAGPNRLYSFVFCGYPS
jgi:hypothetical protein